MTIPRDNETALLAFAARMLVAEGEEARDVARRESRALYVSPMAQSEGATVAPAKVSR